MTQNSKSNTTKFQNRDNNGDKHQMTTVLNILIPVATFGIVAYSVNALRKGNKIATVAIGGVAGMLASFITLKATGTWPFNEKDEVAIVVPIPKKTKPISAFDEALMNLPKRRIEVDANINLPNEDAYVNKVINEYLRQEILSKITTDSKGALTILGSNENLQYDDEFMNSVLVRLAADDVILDRRRASTFDELVGLRPVELRPEYVQKIVDLNINSQLIDKKYRSFAHFALEEDRLDTFSWLLRHDESARELLATADNDFWFRAVRNGNITLVSELLNIRANLISVKNKFHNNAIFEALNSVDLWTTGDVIPMVELLLKDDRSKCLRDIPFDKITDRIETRKKNPSFRATAEKIEEIVSFARAKLESEKITSELPTENSDLMMLSEQRIPDLKHLCCLVR